MTLPEDVREQVHKLVADYEENGIIKYKYSLAEEVLKLITSAKAEGYQEGVWALRNAIYPLADRTDDDIDTVADQLLKGENVMVLGDSTSLSRDPVTGEPTITYHSVKQEQPPVTKEV